MRRSAAGWKATALGLLFFLAGAAAARGAPMPLEKRQVLALIAVGAPGNEVASLLLRDGIAFTPSADFLALLKQSGAGSDPQWGDLVKALGSAQVTAQAAPYSADEQAIIKHLSRGAAFELGTAGTKQDPVQAESEFRAALALDPTDPYLQLALARSLMGQSKLDQAAAEARGVVKALPDLAMARVTLAAILAAKGNADAGIAGLKKAVEMDPDPAFSRSLLARALLDNHMAAGAVDVLQQGLEKYPDNTVLHNSLGTVLFEEGNTQGAIAEFKQALALGSTDPLLRLDYAHALRRAGDFNGAMNEIRDAVRLAPDNYSYHYRLAEALIDARQYPEAMTELDRVIQLRPGFAPAYSERGYVLVMEHQVDHAIDQYREAIKLDPNFATAHSNLGAAYWRKHDNKDGYKEVLLAHELAPNDPAISAQFEKLPDKWKRKAAQPAGIPKPATAPLGAPPKPDFVYFVDAQTNSLVPLEEERPTIGAKSGPFRTSVYTTVIGQHSPVRLKAGSKWDFVIRASSPSQKLSIRLERFESKSGSRSINFGSKVRITSNPRNPGLLKFDSSPSGDSSIQISVPYDLVPGEYGLFVSAAGGYAVFCFGVDTP